MIQQRLSHDNIVKLLGACFEDEVGQGGRSLHAGCACMHAQ